MEVAGGDRSTLPQFIDRVIDALKANDIGHLERLLALADGMEAPQGGGERLEALSKRRLLASLLHETGRNLRLLRRVCGLRAVGREEIYGRLQA